MNDPLLKWREEFPIVEKSLYMVNHSMGAMPRRAMDRIQEYGKMWQERGVRSWHEGWWEISQTVGNLLGKVFHAPENTVVMHQNVSVATALIFSCIDWNKEKRKKIVTSELEFPSVLYVCEEQKRLGAEHVMVKSSSLDEPDYEQLLEAIDEQTKIVVISLVFFRNAALCDVDAVVKKAHAVGAWVLLDAYQGIGTVPLDVKKANVDFMVGGSVKWLCGGPGAGYLYVRPDHIPELEPRITGWSAHRVPFQFETGRVRYADGIERFLHGTPAVPALFAARSGYEIIGEIGVEKIREKSLRQTGRIMELADEKGYPVRTPRSPERRGGSVTLEVPEGGAVVKALDSREVLCDYRPGSGVRISPHFYTKDEEIDRAMEELDNVVETKAYEIYKGTATTR